MSDREIRDLQEAVAGLLDTLRRLLDYEDFDQARDHFHTVDRRFARQFLSNPAFEEPKP